jgi:predicted PurR-regulated permease PerM
VSEGSTSPGSRPWHRTVFYAVSAAVAVAVILASNAVLLPFVLALVVAYVLLPAVRRVERRGVPRTFAILIVYALTLGSIGIFFSQIVPRLVAEGRGLAAEGPRFTATARAEWLPAIDRKLASWSGQPPAPVDDAAPVEGPPPFRLNRLPDGSYEVRVTEGVQFREKREGVWHIEQVERSRGFSSATLLRDGFDRAATYLQENSFELLKIGREIVFAISRGVFTLCWTLMLAAYLMLSHEKIFAFFRETWPPDARGSFDRFLRRLDRGLAGVVRGQLIICLVNGVLSAIGFSLFGLKYWPILALVAGTMSIIPIFGSILSSVPVVAIGLTQSFGTAIGVLVWIVGIHQLEANFLNPKIIGDAAKIHPVLVVFSLIVGEHFFQLPGALFAVPCMSVAQTIFLHFRESTLGLADPLASVLPVPKPAVATPPAPAVEVEPPAPASPEAAATK